MDKISTNIEGVFLIRPHIYKDERGFFLEKFKAGAFEDISIASHFVQDNFSRSWQNVVRGLHTQENQTKLVGVSRGTIYDVAVDIRPGSKTYGKYFATELSDENGLMLFIPSGFLHGFKVISDVADVHYKVNDIYRPESEITVNALDPDLNISWPNKDFIIRSLRDKNASNLKYAL
ncbi:MAG: dTDP-4-dehydrorhamnose 3,5-epimerase [Rickettsiaceae bacterium]|nr:dTDP-4-dehydrorhamnose 3,5-epimerase [Rickettsiaceae bacterium]